MSETTKQFVPAQVGSPLNSVIPSPSCRPAPIANTYDSLFIENPVVGNMEQPTLSSTPISLLPYVTTCSPQESLSSADSGLISTFPDNLTEVASGSAAQGELKESGYAHISNHLDLGAVTEDATKSSFCQAAEESNDPNLVLDKVESPSKNKRVAQIHKPVTAPSDNSKLSEFSEEFVIQTATCFVKPYVTFDRCLSCIKKQTDTCRFKFFRCFSELPNHKLEQKGFVTCDSAEFFSGQIPGLRFVNSRRSRLEPTLEIPNLKTAPSTYVPPAPEELNRNHQYLMSQIQAPLKAQLEAEREFLKAHPTVFYRKPIGPICQICDVCNTGVFAGFWLCKICGKELCLACYKNWESESYLRDGLLERCSYQKTHAQEHFIPVTNYLPERLEELYISAESFSHPAPLPTYRDDLLFSPSEKSLPYPYLNPEDLTQEVFQSYWRKGQPILLRSALGQPMHQVTPDFFIQNYGEFTIDALKLDGSKGETMSIADFFERFDDPESANLNLKIKDFPSTDKFSNVLPSLNRDFMNQLPVPEYMNYSGSLNLVSLLPDNHITPDLGPKMYCAYAGMNAEVTGTTQLHLDAADAINTLQYCSSPAGTAGAIWHLFRREDAGAIRDFIRTKFPAVTIHDPIHDQYFYLTDELLEELFVLKGVKPFIIEQKVGEVVLIPAGCPHQVRNLYPCIKLAMDYVSPEAASICNTLASQFRTLPRLHKRNVDIISTPSLLAQSWNTCLKLQNKLQVFQEGDILLPKKTFPSKKRARDESTISNRPKRKAASKHDNF